MWLQFFRLKKSMSDKSPDMQEITKSYKQGKCVGKYKSKLTVQNNFYYVK